MSMETPNGVLKYPVTKFCMIVTAAVPLIASITSLKYIFFTQFDPFINKYHQFYKYFLFQFGCLNESDMILLILIWYHFRNLERLMGSYKYINIISLLLMYTTVIIVVLNALMNYMCPWIIWNRFPQGGLPLIMGLFHYYSEFTPRTYQFEVLLMPLPLIKNFKKNSKNELKIRLNDKFLVNFLIVLLLLNQGVVGILCGFLCWIIGIFVEKGLFLGAESWKIPYIEKWLSSNGSYTRSRRRYVDIPNGNGTDTTVIRNNNTDNPNIMDLPNISTVNELNNGLVQGNDYIPVGNQQVAPTLEETRNRVRESRMISPTSDEGIDTIAEEEADEPVRPLGVQFLDTFRR